MEVFYVADFFSFRRLHSLQLSCSTLAFILLSAQQRSAYFRLHKRGGY